MGVAITKNGNAYETTSKGKVTAMAIGAGTGGYLAHKNIALIKDKVDDVYCRVMTDIGKSTFDVAKDGMKGKLDGKAVLDNFKANGKIAKYASKVAGFIKKHPVGIGAAIGATLLVGFGAIADKITNNKRANKADLKN